MIFKNKATGEELMGKPLMAMIQLSTHPAHTAYFVLYESLEGHGFFLRESAEFATKFKAASFQGDTVIWSHKVKGGKYRVNPGLYLYDGDDASWDLSVHDGHVMKVYVYRNGNLRFTNDFAAKFVALHDPVKVNMNIKVPDPEAFKASQGQIAKQVAENVAKARRRSDGPYEYVKTVSIPFNDPSGRIASINGQTPEEFLESWKAENAQNFLHTYMDGTTCVAFVKRVGRKGTAVRGDSWAVVMAAARALLLATE